MGLLDIIFRVPFRRPKEPASANISQVPENATEVKKVKQKVDLAIPIYLDVSIMLDLLASIEEGFSVVERVTTRTTDTKTTEFTGATELGLGVLPQVDPIIRTAVRLK